MLKYERIPFGENIWKDLYKRMAVPKNIESESHPILPYFKNPEKQNGLEMVLLEDFSQFMAFFSKNMFVIAGLKEIRGVYSCKKRYLIPKEERKELKDSVKKYYNLELGPRSILTSIEEVNYYTIIHEAVHDLFAHLPIRIYTEIINSLTSQDSVDHFARLVESTPLILGGGEFDSRKIKINDGENAFEWYEKTYTFQNLLKKSKLRLIDESIAYFFTDSRVAEIGLPNRLKKILLKEGYKINNPPEVIPNL